MSSPENPAINNENGGTNQVAEVTEADTSDCALIERVDHLLALSKPPLWLGAKVELTDGSIDYSLDNFTRDH